LSLEKLVAVPNPNAGALYGLLDGSADALDIRVYSSALVRIATFEVSGAFAAGWNRIPLPAAWDLGLPNGIYYVQALPRRQGLTGFGAAPAKLYVAR
jgi:hypothetical protein